MLPDAGTNPVLLRTHRAPTRPLIGIARATPLRRILLLALISAAFAFVAVYLKSHYTSPVLLLELSLDQDGIVQVFFDQGVGFHPDGTRYWHLTKGRQRVEFALPAELRRLRLDPIDHEGRCEIISMTVRRGPNQQTYDALACLKVWQPVNEGLVARGIGHGMEVVSPGADPQLIWDTQGETLSPPISWQFSVQKAARASLVVLFVGGIALTLLALLVPWLRAIDLRPERLVLLLGGVAGLTMVALVPPLQVPDEPLHFLRAYHISQGHLVPDLLGDVGGGTLPKSLLDMMAVYRDLPFRPDVKASRDRFSRAAGFELNPEVCVPIPYANVAIYSCIPYLPQATGILIGRAVGCRPLVLLYLGRIANLLAALSLLWLAVRTTPLFKHVFCLVSLMPMTLFLLGSVSADPITLSLCVLVVALLRETFEPQQPLPRRRVVILYSLLALLALCKSVYVAFPLLLGLIPPQRLGGWNRWAMFIVAGLLISGAASSLWSRTAMKYWPEPSFISGRPTSRKIQTEVVKDNPPRFLKACWRTIVRDATAWRHQMVGVFGWLDAALFPLWTNAYLAVLVCFSLTSADAKLTLGWRDKALIACCILSTVTLTFVALYLWWTPVGSTVVEGIQGRYFIPILPLACLLLYNRRFAWNRTPQQSNGYCAAAAIVMFAVSVPTLLDRYYG